MRAAENNDEIDNDVDTAGWLTEIRGAIDRGQLSQAAALCDRALAEGTRNTGVVPLLALIRLIEGKASMAVSLLQRVEYLYGPVFRNLLRQAENALERGSTEEAAPLIRKAIVLDTYRKESSKLFKAGRREEAKEVMRGAHRTSFWYRGEGMHRYDGRLRIGTFHALGGGTTPTRYIIDAAEFDFESICLLQDFDYPIGHLNEAFDVIFNAASDPDWDQEAVDLAADLADRLSIPVVNAPTAMNATMRHLTSECLTDIPGLYVPQTRRFKRQDLLDTPDAPLEGLSFPVLLRPAGSHGGNGLVKSDDRSNLMVEAAAMTAEYVYVTEYYDFASADGLYRKLRVVFVDGKPFPYHLSISDHWLNHYYRTRTAEEEALQAEEGVFLRDPEAYLGPAAYGAVEEIAKRHPLGFFGVDGAIDREGRLVVFECNATMLVKYGAKEGKNDYKRAPAEAIRSAVTSLLKRAAKKE